MEYIISDPRFFAVVFLIGSTTPLTSAFIGRLHREKKDSERDKFGGLTWAVTAEGGYTVSVFPLQCTKLELLTAAGC